MGRLETMPYDRQLCIMFCNLDQHIYGLGQEPKTLIQVCNFMRIIIELNLVLE